MAKTKAPSILDIVPSINKGHLQSIYYFFGEDYYLLHNTVKDVEKAASTFITSEFDKETFYGDTNAVGEVLDFASAFPFGSEKKLIIVKQFEKVKDKKLLVRYAESPVEFTILILVHDGVITNLDSEPYKTLGKNNFLIIDKQEGLTISYY